MSENIIKIIIVEDHDMFREGIRFVLAANEKYEVISEAANGQDFLEKLKLELPDIVLMDIDMPIMNGIEATTIAVEKYSNLKVICLSMHGDYGHYQKMIEAGAKGFVLKNAGTNQLSEAIDAVAKGGVYFSQELLMNVILTKSDDGKSHGAGLIAELEISEREMDVLELICKGFTNKQIADKLFISVKTVEGHKSKLMLKTNTNNTVSLVLFSIKNQMVEI